MATIRHFILWNGRRYWIGCFLLIIFLGLAPQLRAQTKVKIKVFNLASDEPLVGVAVYDAKGNLVGTTGGDGKADLLLTTTPICFSKNGFIHRCLYQVSRSDSVGLQPLGQDIGTVHITGKKMSITDYLLYLRDQNYPHFIRNDTMLYYHFSYALSFPDQKWSERATGYIQVERPELPAKKSDAYDIDSQFVFIQFHYKNEGNSFVKNKMFTKARPAEPIFLFYADFMFPGNSGWESWKNLTKHYSFFQRMSPSSGYKIDARTWTLHRDSSGRQIFISFRPKEKSQPAEKIIFDSAGRLQKIIRYRPDDPDLVLRAVNLTNNYSKKNGINTIRTVYHYSRSNTHRVLTRIDHTSTYYKKGKTYYKQQFSAWLSDGKPEKECRVPVYILTTGTASNLFEHGYAVWQEVKQQTKQ